MEKDILVKNYAEALVQASEKTKNFEKIKDEISSIEELFQETEGLFAVISSPIVKFERKIQVLQALFSQNSFQEEVQNFLYLLVKNKRETLLFAIVRHFKLLSNVENFICANVTSSQKLNESQKEEVASMLEEKFGLKFSIATREDPKILGGMVIQYGSMLIDLSLKGQLSLIEEQSKRRLESVQSSL